MVFNGNSIFKIILITGFLALVPLGSVFACDWRIQTDTFIGGKLNSSTGGCYKSLGEVRSDYNSCDPTSKPTPTNIAGSVRYNVDCCCVLPTAAETESVIGGSVWANPFDNLQIKIPGLKKFSNPVCEKTDFGESCYVPWIGEYIKGIYNYAIGIAGILALIAVSIGGLLWLTSAGSASKVTEAKSWIVGGVTGLITLTSFLFTSSSNK